ncbi:MAG: Holliday junction resolvase RuvX, partial [Phycisphaerales bacterium]|nr:Holliday junction resolvase RuvX [Phycisphaerales bacterium]
MRYLCVDLGDKRTGTATGDTVTGMVGPGEVLEIPIARREGRELVEALAAAARAAGAGGLVVGLPLNMDGTEGPRAKMVRGFAERLGRATGLPVAFGDERLSSVDADWAMARTGMTRGQKKSRRDALAAAAILRDFLAGLAAGERERGGAA